jgi:hypothetical protein
MLFMSADLCCRWTGFRVFVWPYLKRRRVLHPLDHCTPDLRSWSILCDASVCRCHDEPLRTVERKRRLQSVALKVAIGSRDILVSDSSKQQQQQLYLMSKSITLHHPLRVFTLRSKAKYPKFPLDSRIFSRLLWCQISAPS